MKNTELIKDTKTIVARAKGLVIEKGEMTNNAVINVYVAHPHEDIGTYPYYGRVDERDMDFNELKALVKKSK